MKQPSTIKSFFGHLVINGIAFLGIILSLSCKAQMGYRPTHTYDTVPATFLVTSTRYQNAVLHSMKGYVVREIYSFYGDRMPCPDINTGKNGCDYTDDHVLVGYLDYRRKRINESDWDFWTIKY